MKNNTINQGNSDYIFDGVKIESGEFDFIYNNNHINGAKLINPIYKRDILTDYLQQISEKCTFKKWYFGHYHDNKMITDKDILIYEQIIRIK